MQTQFVKSLSIVAIVTAAFNIQPIQAAEKIIKIDGSSTVFPITEAVAEDFQNEKKSKSYGWYLRHWRRF